MIPGVSRSGATIMGALAMGVEPQDRGRVLVLPRGADDDRRLDARAVRQRRPTDRRLGSVGWDEIAIGFVVSFVVALAVIRAFVAYVSRHGFAPFAWYRIVVGAAAVAWLALR